MTDASELRSRTLNVIGGIEKAWAAGDAEAFAELFTPDGTLVGDAPMRGRDEIRTFMGHGFSGPYQGTSVRVKLVGLRHIAPEVAVALTQGQVEAGGEALEGSDFVATCVLQRRNGEWKIAAYQNSKGQVEEVEAA